MRKIISTLMLATFASACSTSSPDDTGAPPSDVPPVYDVPGGGAATSMLGGARYLYTGETAEGTASFTNAPITDENNASTSSGSGELSLTVDQQVYSAATLESFGLLLDDPSGTYVLLVGLADRTGAGGEALLDQVLVVVPQSDVAAGATVQLDGEDRVAFFASGDPEAPAPTVYAAAVTGEVTFTSGSAQNGGTLSATVTGDFGSIEWIDEEPPPPPVTETLADGSYAVSVNGMADIQCDGLLVGQETEFSTVTPGTFGFYDGSISISDNGTMLSGYLIAGAFGAVSVPLLSDGGLFYAFRDRDEAGPAGTTLVDSGIVLIGETATTNFVSGVVAADYTTSDGYCHVSFDVTLTAP